MKASDLKKGDLFRIKSNDYDIYCAKGTRIKVHTTNGLFSGIVAKDYDAKHKESVFLEELEVFSVSEKQVKEGRLHAPCEECGSNDCFGHHCDICGQGNFVGNKCYLGCKSSPPYNGEDSKRHSSIP